MNTHATDESDWPDAMVLPAARVESSRPASDVDKAAASLARAEHILRESDARYRALVKATSCALYRISADGQKLVEMSGGTLLQHCGSIVPSATWLEDHVHPDDRAVVRDTWRQAIRSGTLFEIEHRCRRRDGTWGWVMSRAAPVRGPSGEVIEWLGAATDITTRKEAEAALRASEERLRRVLEQEKAARQEAERAITTKDEFLAVLSHELRTPLATILLWAKLLRAGAVPSDQRARALETIERSAEAQHRLVEDLLDVTRMLAGTLRIVVQQAELGPVLQAAVEAARPAAAARGVELAASLGAAPSRAMVDPARMQQVVWNLLSNAVKFTERGGRVQLTLRRLGGLHRIQVTDTGCGIHPSFLPHVFDRFRQADASPTRAHGGLGLGLAITRQLVELHGGTIRAESPGEGRGSTFTVDLPAVDDERERAEREGRRAAAPSLIPSAIFRGLRVLLVEDDESTREALQWLFEECQADVTAAPDASVALDAFREALAGRAYDVMVSDIGMPVMDGYELMQQIRALERERGAAPMCAVALTAYTRLEDRLRAAQVGFHTYVAKPVDPETLVATLARLLGRSPSPA